jgi:hypothetical protein
MDTLEAMLVTEVNCDGTCVEFCKMLLAKKDLKKIHNSEKHTVLLLLIFKVRMTMILS